MKTAILTAIAVIVFLGLFRVDVSLVRRNAVDRRAESVAENDIVSAVSDLIGRDDPAYLWAEVTLRAECRQQTNARASARARAEDFEACERAMYATRWEYPFLAIKVTPRLDGRR